MVESDLDPSEAIYLHRRRADRLIRLGRGVFSLMGAFTGSAPKRLGRDRLGLSAGEPELLTRPWRQRWHPINRDLAN